MNHKSFSSQRKHDQNFSSYISNVSSHVPHNNYVPTHSFSRAQTLVNSNSSQPFVQGQGSETNSDTW